MGRLMKKKDGFMLIPGGGMSSWIWDELIDLLDAPTITPEYRVKNNNIESRKTSCIKDCVEYHLQLFEESNLEKMVLVGHSGAGALAAAIAKEIPDRIKSIIYLSANLPKNHTSTLDSLPIPIRLLNRHAIKSQIAIDSKPMHKNAKMIKKYFCNQCNEKTIDFVLEQNLQTEPLCLAFEKYDFDDFPNLMQLYVILTKDMTQTVKQQIRMMKNFNIFEKDEINSDHMVMLSHPVELAAILNKKLNE